MRGYTEHFDFASNTISGWVFDEKSRDNGKIYVRAYYDNRLIGQAKPNGTRTDLASISDQPMVFSISCSVAFTPVDVASGRLRVSAHRRRLVTRLGCTKSGDASIRQAAARQLWTDPGVTAERPTPITWSADEIDKLSPSASTGCLSDLSLPIGLTSQDGTAMIGSDGHLFLTGGSNSLLSQYSDGFDYGSTGLQGTANIWATTFDGRESRVVEAGARYVQTIIPEKLTVMRYAAPVDITAPTLLLQEVENRIVNRKYYVSGLSALDAWMGADQPFLQTDTHFSAAGAQSMFAHLMEVIDPSMVSIAQEIQMDELTYEIGDLSKRFFGIPFYSRKHEPSVGQFSHFSAGLITTRRFFPPTGSIGRSFAWANSTAPCDLNVLVFGNSFFGGGNKPGDLAWWGKHFFKQFRFEWTPNFDWDLVDEIKPDVVIGQTVERFLGTAPVS